VQYADGTAFRRALADRLRWQYPHQDPGRLLKRVAMERFLARVVAALPERARLKGGYALELRLERARATQDVDLAVRDLAGVDLLEALRDAAELDLGDHLTYRIEATTRGAPQGAPYGGERLAVVEVVEGLLRAAQRARGAHVDEQQAQQVGARSEHAKRGEDDDKDVVVLGT